jgi:trk system potassium uptake protein TrkH
VQLSAIAYITGILLALFSVVMAVPAGMAVYYGEDAYRSFAYAFAITLVSGLALLALGRGRRSLRSRDGFAVTVLFYVGLGLFGAIPLALYDGLSLGYVDAAFESLSALTTTGATVLTGLDAMPRSILFYRHLLQWLGGMGIIVLAVAILPMLGIGGMQLYRAETPGPVKDTKLTPRITETAKALWYIYATLTAACAISYAFAGMPIFDAICHSFSTVAIGGLSTHDENIGYFASAPIEAVAVVFMALSGINFGLHFVAWNRRSFAHYWRDPELRLYFAILAGISAVIAIILQTNPGISPAPVRDGIFHAVSMATTSGFTTTDFSIWPAAAPALLVLVACVGGCATSTAGGIKVIRVLLIYKQGMREIRRLIHPNGVFSLKVGTQRVPDSVINAIWAFFSAYVVIFLATLTLLMMLAPVDFTTAFSAVAGCINNVGAGLGGVALNYAGLPAGAKALLATAMVFGRLEIFTLLVFFTPAFWQR